MLNPDVTLDSRYGWILPNGDFYGCDYAGHDRLAEELASKLGLDLFNTVGEFSRFLDMIEGRIRGQHGWIRVASTIWLPESGTISQAQLDTLFDYCTKYGRPMPRTKLDTTYDRW